MGDRERVGEREREGGERERGVGRQTDRQKIFTSFHVQTFIVQRSVNNIHIGHQSDDIIRIGFSA